MNPDRDQQIADLFEKAFDLNDAERAAFLEKACADDASLRAELESLLAHDSTGDDLPAKESLGRARHLLVDAMKGAVHLPDQPETLGPYRILKMIGEGGMGTVYLAEQQKPRRRVALKMIRTDTFSSKMLKRFRFEAEVLGRLKHPGIAQIFEAGEIETGNGPLPFFAMEYVEGVELRQYAEEQNLDVRARLELVARIADAVHHAHQKGIVHRDLKPENVLVVKEPTGSVAGEASEYADLGQPKVLDFGVARATDADLQMTTLQTDAGQLVGTITYMSPEQVDGDSRRLDQRSDIYALGVLLYELLAGRPPFNLRHRSIPEAARIIRHEEPTRLASIHTAFRGDIDTIACKALEKDRDRRYASAADLAADIRRYLVNEPIIAHPPSTFYEIRKFARRHKGLMTGLILAFIILLAGIASSLSLTFRAWHNEKKANRAAFRLNIATAEALGQTAPRQALGYLEAVPEEFRGWEWKHQKARFESHLTAFYGDRSSSSRSTLARRADGKIIAALNRNGGIELIDLATGNLQASIRHADDLTVSALSPDGALLSAWCPAEQMLMLWDVDRNLCVQEIETGVDEPFSTFSADHSHWAVRTDPAQSVVLIEVTTGLKIMETEDSIIGFDAKGGKIAHGNKMDLSLYSLSGTMLDSRPLLESAIAVTFSSDGAHLALAHWHRTITLLDASTLKLEKTIYGHNDHVHAVAFSGDNKYLASASDDHTVRVWDIPTGRMLRVIYIPKTRFGSLMFSEDGSLLAAANADEARLWQWQHDSHQVLEGHGTYAYGVAFSPDGGTLASSGYMTDVRFWDPITGDLLAVFKSEHPDREMGFTPDGSRFICHNSYKGDIRDECRLSIIDPGAGIILAEPRLECDETLFQTLSQDGNLLGLIPNGRRNEGSGDEYISNHDTFLRAMVVDDKEIHIRDTAVGRTIRVLGPHERSLCSLAFSPDSSMILCGDEAGDIKVWDLATGAESATLQGHVGIIYSICFSPDQNRIASGGNDGNIVLWDSSNFDRVSVLRGHTSYVRSICFSPDGTMLASASGDGTVRIWDTVPPADRWKQRQAMDQLRLEAEPIIEKLLNQMSDPLDVADYLRADKNLDDDLRRAALRCLLKTRKP